MHLSTNFGQEIREIKSPGTNGLSLIVCTVQVWEMTTITEDVYPLEKHDNQVEKVLPAEGQGWYYSKYYN